MNIYLNLVKPTAMQKLCCLVTTVCFIATLTVRCQVPDQSNPLLVHSNKQIPFNTITASTIHSAVKNMLLVSDARIAKIAAIPAGQRTVANTLMAVDELQYDISDLSMKLGLIGQTYEDDSTRNAANDDGEKLSVYSSNLFLNEGLYKSLKQLAALPVAAKFTASQQKFLQENIVAFEKNGMKLNADDRKKLQVLNEKLAFFGVAFDKNIAQYKDSVAFTKDELAGVPANTMAPWQTAAGNYIVNINGPNYFDIMEHADNSKTRHTMYVHYNNRAYPENIKMLDSLFYYRQQFANLLGFKSYAAYAVADKMAASPANVWNFENNLVAKLTPNVTKEINDLRQIKKQEGADNADTVYAWDYGYYVKKLLDTKYQLNTDEVRQYFEMNNTVAGMFKVYEKLFDIQIKSVDNVPLWQAKVKSYEMFKDGKKAGSFYLDLYPRPNKYTHFACFPISQYRKADGKEVLPVSALICNFPEGNATEPSLLTHYDVVTMFHEFGHLVHSMMGRADIAMQGPFFVKGDFAEAPSQFLENFCWEYEPLKMLARNYKTGEILPRVLFDKMKATELVNISISYIRQLYFGVLDFTYEDKYDSLKTQDISKVAENLYTMLQTPFPAGTHFIASFTHLNGYAANYYGYLWSKVFAQDMFSVFKKNGVMDVPTGIKYRKEILEKGATIQEQEMLKNFLGRTPNSDAFLQSLGIK